MGNDSDECGGGYGDGIYQKCIDIQDNTNVLNLKIEIIEKLIG